MKFYKGRILLALSIVVVIGIRQPVAATEGTTSALTETTQEQTTAQGTTEKGITAVQEESIEQSKSGKTTEKRSKATKKKDKKTNSKKDKKKKRNIKAPEDVIKKKSVMAWQIRSKLKKELKALYSEKEDLLHAQEVNKSIRTFYQKMELKSREEAVPMEVLLTGIKKENAVAVDYDVNQELSNIAILEDEYLNEILKEYIFSFQGGISVINAMKDEELVQLKPYLDKRLAATGQPEEQRQNQIEKLNKKIKAKNKEISDLKPKEERIFNPTDLRVVSHLSEDEIRYILKGTALEELAPAFRKCEETFKVNAVAIMGIAIHESAWGTSRRAVEDHNLTGYGVTTDSAKGINANTKEENLMMTAKLLKEKYLPPTGAYYHKAPSIIGVNYHYCVGDEWAAAVTNYGYQLMEKLK